MPLAHPLTSSDRSALRAAAIEVLERNRRVGVSSDGDAYDFVCPSPGHYPFQWFWDSCFHAIALTHVDVGRALQELRGLAAAADPDGFMPHMILWDMHAHLDALARYNIRLLRSDRTATIQPPVLAIALERVYRASEDLGVLDELLPTTIALFDWLAQTRDPDRDGLIAIIQPDESGLDASPKYDALMAMPTIDDPGLVAAMQRLFSSYAPLGNDSRGMLLLDVFNVEDVLVNSIYIQGLGILARLAREAGASTTAARLDSRRDLALDSLLTRCWDPTRGVFWDLAGDSEQQLRLLTITSLLPLIIADLPSAIADRLVHEHLLNESEFWLEFPLPSVALAEPAFEPDFASQLIWRGPTWVNTNWFLVGGLRQHGYMAEADELAERTLRMVAGAGFREFFNPFTGEGYGAHSFGWSTLVLDLLD
jgi:glycogen debranching enzyme